MILIYTPTITNRIKYAFKLVFKSVLGCAVKITSNVEEFNTAFVPKLYYAPAEIEGFSAPFIQSVNLLSEKHIKPQELAINEYKNTTTLFHTNNSTALLPFDIFAASFFLASRYEEYLPNNKDIHDRYLPENSTAYKNNFLETPVINIWCKHLLAKLLKLYPFLEIEELKKFTFQPTIDIDIAYSYKGKGYFRNTFAMANNFVKGQFYEIKERVNVLISNELDPYDTYQYQKEIADKYNVSYIYFVNLGNYGSFDKNLPASSYKLQHLLKTLSDRYKVFIHPSYQSNIHTDLIKEEMGKLYAITHRPITSSRQHYLKLSLPETYRNLLKHDITNDYSMGYASKAGFRASICSPYYFYDLEYELETPLVIHSFAYMDGTFNEYLNYPTARAKECIAQLVKLTKENNGEFICIWHNTSLTNTDEWKGWRDVFEYTFKQVNNT